VEIYYFTRKLKNAKTLVRRHLKKLKCRSCRQLQNIFCGPDSPLFALPQLSHLAKYEWIFHFLIVELYYFTRKLKKCQKTGSTAPKKIKFRSGRQHQNIFCGPDSPLFALPQQSHLAKYEWLFHFLIVKIYYSTRKKWKIAKPLVRWHLNKFKCRSGCQLKNIFCAPDSPLFAFSRLSHQVKYEWIFHFLIGEIYYFTRKLKNAKILVRRRLKKFKCRSGCQLQNIFCGPDSPLLALPQLSHLAKYE